MKYFQTSWGKLGETLSADKKHAVQKLTVQFLTTHSHFSKDWKELSSDQKNEVIEIIIGGKGIIPYVKIESIDSLEITPKDGIFFSKDEFFSTLKGKMVDDESYENSKKLYILLKMRNLSDLNDLYNAQDVIILLEMMENRFQSMQEKSGYNSRIINFASKLSGCIQREQTKSIFVLPVNNTQVEVFEKILCSGFSCVNPRFPFNTEILMHNLTKKDYHNISIDQSFKTFKRDDLKVIYSLKLDRNDSFEKKKCLLKLSSLTRTISTISQ